MHLTFSRSRTRAIGRVTLSIFCLVLLIASEVIAQNSGSTFAFTNRRDAFFAGTIDGENMTSAHGITKNRKKLFENYWMSFGGTRFDRSQARATLDGSMLRRNQSSLGTTEEIVFADSLTLLIVKVNTTHHGAFEILPGWSAFWNGAASSVAASTKDAARASFVLTSSMTAVATVYHQSGSWTPAPSGIAATTRNPTQPFIPMMFTSSECSGSFYFTVEIVAAGSPVPTRTVDELERLIKQKRDRIEQRIARFNFECAVPAIHQLVETSISALDALAIDGPLAGGDHGVGILAGLPWLDDVWGRDLLISIPGAFLAQGDFENAKKALLSYSKTQHTGSGEAAYGRLARRASEDTPRYTASDLSAWFARQCGAYIRASGDREFARTIFPVLDRAIIGTLTHAVAENGLLKHADAETWMDAIGNQGAWSPRGSFAVEVQALWIDQLRVSAWIAVLAGKNDKAQFWNDQAAKAERSFIERFVRPESNTLVDRLYFDNTRDDKMRPNTLIALASPLIYRVPEPLAFNTLAQTMRACVYRTGVASLSQLDADFHPYHNYPGYYTKEAAYHNGVIWPWLSGQAISLLCRYGLHENAFALTESLANSMATRQESSLPELTDAMPRPGEELPRSSGCFSQAWSLAEVIRSMHEDYLGIRPNAIENVLSLAPRLPQKMDHAEANARIGNVWFRVKYDVSRESELICQVTRLRGSGPMRIALQFIHGNVLFNTTFDAPPSPDQSIMVTFDTNAHQFIVDGQKLPSTSAAFPVTPDDRRAVQFCTPFLRTDLAAIKRPNHAILDAAIACSRNPAAPILFSKLDPPGDDLGPHGKYNYPSGSFFQRGIFDISSLTVASDKEMVYFTVKMNKLVQPGWHPEYGFQLTMLALAIDIDGVPRSGSRYVRHNSRVILPNDVWYERLILVGGGIQVLDKNDAIVAEYIPTDARYPMGDVRTGEITFAIPVRYLGEPNAHWDYYLVAGGQDDHGIGGIGEFRTVNAEASDTNGGGNTADGPNIYDTLTSK